MNMIKATKNEKEMFTFSDYVTIARESDFDVFVKRIFKDPNLKISLYVCVHIKTNLKTLHS